MRYLPILVVLSVCIAWVMPAKSESQFDGAYVGNYNSTVGKCGNYANMKYTVRDNQFLYKPGAYASTGTTYNIMLSPSGEFSGNFENRTISGKVSDGRMYFKNLTGGCILEFNGTKVPS